VPVFSLELVDDRFYDLDVCLNVLSDKAALVFPPAFSPSSYAKIEAVFDDLIVVTEEEAMNFVCNAHCPDSKHVILQKGSSQAEADLKALGFVPIPVDTSEFMKAGGSVFCMKMDLSRGM
jgi:N-dimethylarginine dimethylaminohydrolase